MIHLKRIIMTSKSEQIKLAVNVYKLSGEKIGSAPLSTNIFAVKKNPELVAQAVRVYLSNQRKAKPRVKTRGEVVGSTRKIWKQKGTGRARHGSLTAPIFVGGGIAHGPTGRENWKLKFSKKMKKMALFSVLTEHYDSKKICAVADIAKINPKTKKAELLLNKIKETEKNLLEAKKVIVVVDKHTSEVKRAFGNLRGKGVLVKRFSDLNTYLVLNSNYLIFDEKVLEIEK